MHITSEAQALHDESVVIDLHGDTLMAIDRGYDFYRRHRTLPFSAATRHIDAPRMREGGLDAQVFGLVTLPLGSQFRNAARQVELLWETAARQPDTFRVVTEADQIVAARAKGQLTGLLGLEGVHALDGELNNLDRLAARGLRLCGISHFSRNEAASPAMGWGRNQTHGLTSFGRDIVTRCNELGVVLDLAHINKPGFMEAAAQSRHPVVVSHTGVVGAKKHRRNIDDDQIRAVADTGGAVGVIFAINFVGFRGGVDAVVNHLIHCVNVGGEDCPALGSDFDGMIVPVRGLGDVSALPRLTDALLRRGLSPRVVKKILGENVLRVLRDVPHRGVG